MDEPDSVTAEVVRRAYRIPASIICVGILIFQAYVTNHYLVSHYDKWWLLWIIADVAVISLFVSAFIICGFYFVQSERRTAKYKKFLGELPLAYIAWFLYSVLLATRVAIIFKNFAYSLTENDFFGPNMLKSNIALSSIVFFLLVLIHADAAPNSKRDIWINSIIFRISMDVLDTVALLEVLFLAESHVLLSFEMHKAIIAIGCMNLIIPTVPLIVLSWTAFGKSEVPKILDTLHIVLYLVVVNLPMLVIRLILWHVHSYDISVFIIKNVLSIGLTVKKIYDHLAEIYKDSLENRLKAEKNEVEMRLRNKEGQPTTELSEGQARSVFI